MTNNIKQRNLYIGVVSLALVTALVGVDSYQAKESYKEQVEITNIYIAELDNQEDINKKQAKEIENISLKVEESEAKIKEKETETTELHKHKKELEDKVVGLEQDLKIEREKKQKTEAVALETEQAEAEDKVATETVSTENTENSSSLDKESTNKVNVGDFNITFYSAYDGTQSGVTAGGTDMAGGNITTSDGYTIVAVDPSVIPLGTILKLTLADGTTIQGKADDTGGAIQGNKIDIATSNPADALSKGRTTAKVEILN